MEKGFPDVSAGGVMQSGTLATALLFGISNAMLGMSHKNNKDFCGPLFLAEYFQDSHNLYSKV